jgi:hypothetical protein
MPFWKAGTGRHWSGHASIAAVSIEHKVRHDCADRLLAHRHHAREGPVQETRPRVRRHQICIVTIDVVGFVLDRLMSLAEKRFKTAEPPR